MKTVAPQYAGSTQEGYHPNNQEVYKKP